MVNYDRLSFSVVLLALVISCVSGDPASTTLCESDSFNRNLSRSPSRAVFALGNIFIPEDRSYVELVPFRTAGLHLNVVNLLEGKACDNCLQIGNFFITSNDRLMVDITLRHPYPGLDRYTGFDVRAIVITGMNYEFPVSGRKINWDGNLKLLFPDGYTTLYNPTEFPVDLPGPPALRYIPGNFASGGDLSATLNPFISFKRDKERRFFETTVPETKTLSFQMEPGPIEFGYAVDACWTLVENVVNNPLDDFPLTANCREAYAIFGRQGAGLKPLAGTSAPYQVEIWDHQGVETISTVTIEAPDLFDGVEFLTQSNLSDNGVIYEGNITNEKGVLNGDYPLLIRVIDWDADENLGQIDAWQVATIKVTDIGYPINQLIYIPAGEFFMGVDPANDPYEGITSLAHASPGHMHPTDAYYIGKYEVTNQEFELFIAAGGYDNPEWWTDYGWEWKTTYNITEPFNWDAYLNGNYYPDACVSVRVLEAEAFCKWAGGRLPTEAEWERAARGDNDHRLFPWGDDWNPEYLAWQDNPLPLNLRHAIYWPVGLFPEGNSPWGLADCAGNISELCSEWWMGPELYEQYATGDLTPPPPPGPDDEIWRKTKRNTGHGGTRPGDFRCAFRWRTPDIRTSIPTGWGIRIAFDAD